MIKVKDYTKSIKIIRARLQKLRGLVGGKVSVITALEDALECMERCNAKEAESKGGYVKCPSCNKEFAARNGQEFKHGERICNNCGQIFKW